MEIGSALSDIENDLEQRAELHILKIRQLLKRNARTIRRYLEANFVLCASRATRRLQVVYGFLTTFLQKGATND